MHICTVIVALAFNILMIFSLLLFVSLVALTLTAVNHQRTPHHASTENTTSKYFFQNQVKQEISITQDLFGCQEKHKENKEKKKKQTQRKSTNLWLSIVFPSISTLFHHFLTNQTRNKEN